MSAFAVRLPAPHKRCGRQVVIQARRAALRPEIPASRPRLFSPARLVLSVLFILVLATPGFAATISLPLTVDYPLLTALYRRTFFTAGAENLALADQRDGCNYLYLSEPRFSAHGDLLRLDLRVAARVGASMGDHCLASAQWRGQICLLLRPQLDGKNFILTFTVADSALLTPDGRPDRMAGILWNFVSPLIFRHAGKISFDFAPPTRELQGFLPTLFPWQSREQSRDMINSLVGQSVAVKETGLTISLRLEAPLGRAPRRGDAPSDAELARAARLWEQWDSLLVRLLAVFNRRFLTEEDRDSLSEILLDTRYAFVAALDDRHVGEDFVRRQFLSAWQQIAPIFRRRLDERPEENPWGYLSFLTAADALRVFDALGPALGLEISEQGLARLAQMLGERKLHYSGDVQPFLRDLLTLPEAQPQAASPAPEISVPPDDNFIEGDLPPDAETPSDDQAQPEEQAMPKGDDSVAPSQALPEAEPETSPEAEPEIPPAAPPRQDAPSSPDVAPPSNDSPDDKAHPGNQKQPEEQTAPADGQSGWWPVSRRVFSSLSDALCPIAAAADAPAPWWDEDVIAWKTPPDNAAAYLEKMLSILTATANKQRAFAALSNPAELLVAMAWQESCFRQFIPKSDGRMTFVLSSNRSSVGLMQVNERVWRGLYDQERLRWDMPYNAAAGAEIAALYLRQYALKKKARLTGDDMLAAAVYAMYNGGPGQLDKFIRRAQNGDLYKSDRLFFEKLRWSKTGAWNKAGACLKNA
ncbi:MAG: transglycosylase SLT domain-containing protein [Desulfobulbaceae bacterium]|jgi:hypothetical protein|nr:transglycosylase SLT domain-containing protein [Desulfobulbaceae bacterium]